eukprot:scaffold98976_cov19-Prasinocladus_malaysianus.AAC.1
MAEARPQHQPLLLIQTSPTILCTLYCATAVLDIGDTESTFFCVVAEYEYKHAHALRRFNTISGRLSSEGHTVLARCRRSNHEPS